MTRVSRNVIANFSGRAWAALLIFAFLPIYVRLMGVESFGLVGAFTSLTVVLSVLDLGLSTTLNRELARLSANEASPAIARHLVRTLEYLYWATGAVLGLGIAALAPLVARYWLKSDHLPVTSLTQAVVLMGFVVVLQWPSSLYSGGLLGLQRQVALNIVNIVVATVRGVGASLVLWLVSPTVQAFFIWQLLASGFQTAALGFMLWRSLEPADEKPAFTPDLLRSTWYFAAGMTGISLTSVVLTQMDKIVLSRLLSLTMFGYYSIAGSVGFGLASLATPIFAAVFPKMTQLVAQDNEKELVRLYHRSCQLLALVVVPVSIGVATFAPDVLELWLRDLPTVRETQMLTSVLTIGTMLNSLMLMPLALQLSNGWTRLSVIKNVCALVAFVPCLLVMTHRWGAIGAAATWVFLNVAYVAVEIPIMHRRLLRTELGEWYVRDFAMPLVAAVAVTVPSRMLMSTLPLPARAAWMIVTIAAAFIATLVTVPAGRDYLRRAGDFLMNRREPRAARTLP